MDNFKKTFKNANIVELEKRTIKIDRLSIKMKGSDGFSTTFSYGGVEIQVVIDEFVLQNCECVL